VKIAKPKSPRFGDVPSISTGGVGWICPKCGHVWSPRTPECFDCNRPTMEIIR
jgi:uncharacterized OB-fold protein